MVRRAADVLDQLVHPRGDFVRAAQEHGRDFTVDWVHLKLNDVAARTVICKDPFAAVDPRVDELIAHIRSTGQAHGTPRMPG